MYSNKLEVEWLDITDVTSSNIKINSGTLDDLFNEYSYNDKVDLSDGKLNVKIRDLYGWTNLLYMEKEIYRGKIYFPYDVNNIIESIGMSPDQKVPVFTRHKHIKGFQGNIEYKYDIILPKDINEDYFRYFTDDDIIFTKMKLSTIDDCDVYGFRIVTSSGWAILNNFMMLTCENDTPPINNSYR